MIANEYNGFGKEVGRPAPRRSLRPIVRVQYSDDLRERKAFAIRSAPLAAPGPL